MSVFGAIAKCRTGARLPHHRHRLAGGVQPEDLAGEAGCQIELLVGPDGQPAGETVKLPLGFEGAVQVEHLHAVVLAVGDEQLVVRGHEDGVRLVELPRRRALAAPAREELAGAIEAEHTPFAAPVSLHHEHIAVRREGNVGRLVEQAGPGCLVPHARLPARAEGEQQLPLRVHLHHRVPLHVGGPDAAVGGDAQTVRAVVEPLTHRPQVGALRVELHQGVLATIEHPHVPLRIERHAGRGAERDAVWQTETGLHRLVAQRRRVLHLFRVRLVEHARRVARLEQEKEQRKQDLHRRLSQEGARPSWSARQSCPSARRGASAKRASVGRRRRGRRGTGWARWQPRSHSARAGGPPVSRLRWSSRRCGRTPCARGRTASRRRPPAR